MERRERGRGKGTGKEEGGRRGRKDNLASVSVCLSLNEVWNGIYCSKQEN